LHAGDCKGAGKATSRPPECTRHSSRLALWKDWARACSVRRTRVLGNGAQSSAQGSWHFLPVSWNYQAIGLSVMLKYDQFKYLPTAKDLPDSDDTPVDNELQDLIPHLLKAILALVWAERWDWFFGVDMGVYYDPNKPAIVPDGFLSLGVQRLIDESLRLSYLLWEEKRIPILVLEVVSEKPGKEYTSKKQIYQELGFPYYVIYNPQRSRKAHLEVYRLVNGVYDLVPGSRVWLPEVGLAIGCERGTYQGITREWLYWYDELGTRLLTPEERAAEASRRAQAEELRRAQAEQGRAQAEQRAQSEQQRRLEAEQRAAVAELRAQRLAELLRSAGIDPDVEL
jgi:Uma2 family endonuclease